MGIRARQDDRESNTTSGCSPGSPSSKALSIAGLDENLPKDATKWTTEVIMPLREHATPIVVDHVVKSATRAMPYARGAGSKLADTEVMWYVEAELKFNRTQRGRLRLTKHKDREGILPPEIFLAVGDGAGLLSVERIDGEASKEDRTLAKIKASLMVFLNEHDGERFSTKYLEEAIAGTRGLIRTALTDLVGDPALPYSSIKGDHEANMYGCDASAATALAVG